MPNSYESFNIIFNSRGNNVINNTSLNSVVYFVNWGSILPTKFKTFRCQFVFKSENYAGNLVDNGLVNINFTRANVYDGTSNTTNLGIIYPCSLVGNSSFYNSTNNDNNDFTISYPSNQTVTISLKNFAGANMANMPHYCLILNLMGIYDSDES